MYILWMSLAGLLSVQLIFVCWNTAQLPRLPLRKNDARGAGLEVRKAQHREIEKELAPAEAWHTVPRIGCSADRAGHALEGAELAAEAEPGQTSQAPGSLHPHISLLSPNVPVISVLIPARNEENNLPACLSSVLGCRTGGMELEVIVLDDRSSDATGRIAEAAARRDPRVRVIRGADRPPGWMGKSYACHQLAQAAEGTWWLFLDADVRLRPDALQAVMAEADFQGRGLITGFPRQETGTWLERLAVPMMALVIACHLPIRLVRQSRDPRFVAAHGAFMCIHRDSYTAAGGHEGIASSLLDDMMLARRVKEAGDPVLLCAIHEYADMRMYDGAQQVWNGYKKNIYEGVSRSGYLLGSIMTGYLLGYVLPAVILILSLILGWWETAGLAAIPVILGMGIKAVSDGRSGRPIWEGILMPASAAAFIAIAAASWRAGSSGQGYIWKGRHYS